MSKVADLKAKFNQDLQFTKPPISPKKPVAAPAIKPKTTVKPHGVTNGGSKPPPLVPNGLDLKSIQLKPSVKSKPITSPKPWEKEGESSSQPSVAELRSKLRSVSSQPSTTPKPQITPKPAAKPPVQSPRPPPVTQKPKNFSTGDGWKRGAASERRDHSATGSIGSTKSDSSVDKEESFILAPLPPLETIGSPPQKPPKPRNVKLPPPTGVRSCKPVEPPSSQPAVPPRVPPPTPPDGDGPQEVYDDVEKPPPLPPMANRPSLSETSKRVSMIPTMNSDDEMEPEELYDEGSSGPVIDAHPPELPSIDSLPIHHPHQTSGGSSSSHIQTSGTSDNTGSGGDSGEVYDPVEEEHDFDELYEPLDMDQQPNTAAANGGPESNAEKEKEAERKRLEKQRKEEEKQQKKEEERRKKEEKEEKKKKEKAEKELKKKFKVKGDWTVEGTGTAKEDVADENDKLSVICTKGETLEILRKDSPNPPGKWLVRNERGDPGYIDSSLVQMESDFGELYDDVGISDGEGDFQDVYDTAS